MGQCCSKVTGQCCSTAKPPTLTSIFEVSASDLSALEYGGPLLVRLLRANNVPELDLMSESDVFVRGELIGPDGTAVPGGTAKWPIKWDASNPLWDSARLFGTKPPMSNSTLRLHFFDHDDSNADDYIGTASVKVSRLGGENAETTLPIELHHKIKPSKSGLPTVTLRREPSERYSGRRVIYLVRHGESVWNKAQDEKRIDVMLSDVDHPLNATGRAQAETLLAALRKGGAQADELLDAEAVMCSPLTRAVQTCLIGLEPLLLRGAGVVHLNPNLREKRNAGGKDSSGKWVGAQLERGVHSALDKLFADEPARAATLKSVPFGLEHVQNKWWLGSKESVDLVKERIAELMYQVRFAEPRSQVIVGHSHYFRELFRHFAAPACTLADAAGKVLPVAEMTGKKLSNAGVAKCVLDFDAHPDAPVVEVQLLFGTELVS